MKTTFYNGDNGAETRFTLAKGAKLRMGEEVLTLLANCPVSLAGSVPEEGVADMLAYNNAKFVSDEASVFATEDPRPDAPPYHKDVKGGVFFAHDVVEAPVEVVEKPVKAEVVVEKKVKAKK